MITVSRVTKGFGSRVLYRDAELRVGARDRIAIVGPNGSGKTTLLEMVVGAQTPDAGEVAVQRDAVVGYLRQETDELRGRTVLAEVIAAGPAMSQAGHRLELLAREIEEADGGEREALLHEYAELQGRFADLGGYSVETQARRILSGLGFSDRDIARQTDELSGGWLMRVALAKLLLAAPDVLLLDEPTNHLDLESVRWLERFLRAYEGAVLLISHDRDFMNGFATRVVEIDIQRLWTYTGDYEAFVRQRELRLEQQAAAAKNQAKRVEQIESFVERFRYKASKARQVQSRIKMLDRMERVQAPGAARRAMKLGFPPPPRSGRVVLSLRDVAFSYGDTRVYEGLDVEIERGQKVALVGPNGAGKTTLLKLLAGVLQPQDGERAVGHNVTLGYFAQHQIEALDPSNRVLEELQRAIPPGAPVKPRDLLGRFLFSGDEADKPVSVLSGGERTRLALAKLLVSPVNLLCLDEPTNHIDITSRDVLEDALEEYGGAIVLITHDRHLIRSVANRILEVDGGRVRSFDGDYESYLWRAEQERSADEAPRAERPAVSAKEKRRAAAEERARLKGHRDALGKVERELEELHARAKQLEAQLADPDFYGTGGDGVQDAVLAYQQATERIAELEPEWERLATELEELSSTS